MKINQLSRITYIIHTTIIITITSLSLCTSVYAKAPTNLASLLNDFKRYSPTTFDHHSGSLYQHSLWTALAVDKWFKDGNVWWDGIDASFYKTAVLAALLHDIGKAGDLYFAYPGKPGHPHSGFEYITGQRLYKINNYSSIDISVLLNNICKRLGIDHQQQKMIAIIVGMHWEFGKIMIQWEKYHKNDALLPIFFQHYLQLLSSAAAACGYNDGHIDSTLVRLTILVSAADVRGAQPVMPLSRHLLGCLSIDAHTFPPDTKEHSYTTWCYGSIGKMLREKLLEYFDPGSSLRATMAGQASPG